MIPNTSRLLAGVFALALMSTFATGLWAGVVSAQPAGTWVVTYEGVSYDYQKPSTTFSYTISCNGSCQDLSHAIWGVCADAVPDIDSVTVTVSPDKPLSIQVGPDPTTGIPWGVKDEGGQKNGTAYTYYLEVEGIWGTADTQYGLKYGGTSLSITTTGLDCASVDLNVAIECPDYNSPNPYSRQTVINRNANEVSNVELVVKLPDNIEYDYFTSSGVGGTVSCQVDGTYPGTNPQTVTCQLNQLAEGEQWVVDIYVIDHTTSPTEVTHQATVSSSNTDVYQDNNTAVCSTTTPVTLSYIRCDRRSSVAYCEWETATEVGNLGFYLADQQQNLVHQQLIASKVMDSLATTQYAFTYQGAWGRQFYLIDVDVFGQRTWHGPFRFGEPAGVRDTSTPIDWAAIHREQDQLSQRKATAPSPEEALALEGFALDTHSPSRHLGAVPYYPTVALRVSESGLYKVSYEELAALGLELSRVKHRDIALTSPHGPVPVEMNARGAYFGPGSYFLFRGEGLDTLYTDTNVYRVSVNPAKAVRISTLYALGFGRIEAEASYQETTTQATQWHYSPTSIIADPWYMGHLTAYPGGGEWQFSLRAKGVMPTGEAELEVRFWGVTDWPYQPDHHVVVVLNGHEVGEALFDGREEHKITARINSTQIQEHNQLTIRLPGDIPPVVEARVIALESITLTYPRKYEAVGDYLEFSSPGRLFRVAGFSSPDILVFCQDDTGQLWRVRARVRYSGGLYSAEFAGAGREYRYTVLTTDRLKSAQGQVVLNTRAPKANADLLVISHPSFVDHLEISKQYWRSQGLSYLVADTESIYNEYGHGVFDPSAIQQYLADMITEHGVLYVLLVGGDTYDYRNYRGFASISFVPTRYTATDDLIRYAPADGLLADVDGDLVADVAIGRYPVQTVTELVAVQEKSQQYSSNHDYLNRVLAVADKHDGLVSYTALSNEMLTDLPGWEVLIAYLDYGPVSLIRDTVMTGINTGARLTTWTGHSSYTTWSFNRLFESQHVRQLTNEGKPTFVLQWGCWNTYFVHPNRNTLGHVFMTSEGKGAAGAIGTTALTHVSHERVFSGMLTPRLAQPGLRVGDALLLSQQQLARERPGSMRDMTLGMTLLGDPTLVITPK